MARWSLLLCCLLGACEAAPSGEAAAEPVSSPELRRDTRALALSAADRWLDLVAEYARERAGNAATDDAADWFPRPIPISLPIGRGGAGDGRGGSLPVLIVPVPVPASASGSGSAQCIAERNPSVPEGADPAPTAAPALRRPQPAEQPSAPKQPLQGRPAAPPPPPYDPFEEYGEEPALPYMDNIVSSQQLVEMFREQVAPDPESPPVVIPDYTAGEEMPEEAEGPTGAEGAATATTPAATLRRTRQVFIGRYQQPERFRLGAEPAPPRFDRSLVLRGRLTVPRSGYTEPYTVWWEPGSGAARVDLHGGATSTYRLPLPDGRVQGIEMRVDRTGEREMRRCSVAAPRPSASEDRRPPALPDLNDFSFAGYFDTENGRVERWTRTVSGGSGELGAVRGETLTFRHEVVVARAADNVTATPLRYSVGVDSSVLGADCDGYVHRYLELRERPIDAATFSIDPAEACESLERGASRRRVEPLREYTLPHRDPARDDDYLRFKAEHRRRYLDDVEQAVRKTLLVQNSRFIESGNRQGATFDMQVNYLGDRLDAESSRLSGVREQAETLPAERFPHSREQLAATRRVLPRAFDWRDRGGVTPVRFQGVSCMSCWAFAVTGAVEGALFVRTRRLVPLSEQSLVDCAHPFGGHGCGRTWPSAAYDYVQERGLPALADYTAYQEKVLPCKEDRVQPVTRISAHVNVTRNSVQALKVAIRRHAPTVVLIATSAKSFQFYKSGVLYDGRCPRNSAEHAVLAVGWGEQRKEPHFVLKNSWSEKWGDGGYVRVHGSSNTCGVLSRPSYPRLERPDVLRIPPDLQPLAA